MRRTAGVLAGVLQSGSTMAMVGGAGLLVAMSVAASLAEYGTISLVDGYWLGPTPWTPLGVGLVLFGATAAVAATGAVAWLGSSRAARLASASGALSVAFWWATATMMGGGACCVPPSAFDAITVAYSTPSWTGALVVGPAALLVLVDWLWRPAPVAPAMPDYRTVSGA